MFSKRITCSWTTPVFFIGTVDTPDLLLILKSVVLVATLYSLSDSIPLMTAIRNVTEHFQ